MTNNDHSEFSDNLIQVISITISSMIYNFIRKYHLQFFTTLYDKSGIDGCTIRHLCD